MRCLVNLVADPVKAPRCQIGGVTTINPNLDTQSRLVRVRGTIGMYELKVVTKFAAAHRLTMVGTKCENMHGHNWKIEVYVMGEHLDKSGVLVDFGVIKKHVAEIMTLLDHKYLNELPSFENKQPSSENIANLIATELQRKIDDSAVTVSRVTAWESDDAGATYIVTRHSSFH